MDTSRKICTILTPADLSAGNIKATVKTIEHNTDKFYLLQSSWQTNLWEVVEQLGKISEDENTLTRMRIAYDLQFDLRTVLKTGGDLSSDGTEVKRLSDLLEILSSTRISTSTAQIITSSLMTTALKLRKAPTKQAAQSPNSFSRQFSLTLSVLIFKRSRRLKRH